MEYKQFIFFHHQIVLINFFVMIFIHFWIEERKIEAFTFILMLIGKLNVIEMFSLFEV